jgi:predicted nuclease with TOPRIM domain
MIHLTEKVERLAAFIEPLGILEEKYDEMQLKNAALMRQLEEKQGTMSIESIDDSSNQRKQFEIERNRLENERKQFTEAAIRLGKK